MGYKLNKEEEIQLALFKILFIDLLKENISALYQISCRYSFYLNTQLSSKYGVSLV